MEYTCCVSLGGHLDFLDLLQKSFLSLTSVMAFDIEALRKAIYLKLENNYFSIFKQVYHCAVEQLKLITS